jgi:hypothetical protein
MIPLNPVGGYFTELEEARLCGPFFMGALFSKNEVREGLLHSDKSRM